MYCIVLYCAVLQIQPTPISL